MQHHIDEPCLDVELSQMLEPFQFEQFVVECIKFGILTTSAGRLDMVENFSKVQAGHVLDPRRQGDGCQVLKVVFEDGGFFQSGSFLGEAHFEQASSVNRAARRLGAMKSVGKGTASATADAADLGRVTSATASTVLLFPAGRPLTEMPHTRRPVWKRLTKPVGTGAGALGASGMDAVDFPVDQVICEHDAARLWACIFKGMMKVHEGHRKAAVS